MEATPLTKRLGVSTLLVGISTYTIFWAPAWLFFLVIETFVLIGLSEFWTLAERKGILVNRPLGLIIGGLLPLGYFVPADGMIFVLGCLALFLSHFSRKSPDQALVSTAVTTFGVVYVAWFFSFIVKMRYLVEGAHWVFYTVLIVKLGDAAAYFFGKKFGRNKLIESISPNKSVEGAIAGFLTTVLASLVSKAYLSFVPVWHLLILGIAVAFMAALGDLAESLIKRDVGVKDSGKLPGLGGMLDVLDSLLLTIPFVYSYISLFLS